MYWIPVASFSRKIEHTFPLAKGRELSGNVLRIGAAMLNPDAGLWN